MRSFILGIVILMSVPAYAVGQQRDRSERSATGRTAVPREEVGQAAPARQTNRRAEPRGATRTPASLEEKSVDAAPPRDRAPRQPGQRDGNYRPRYRRPQSRANVVFVPYAAPVIVEQPLPARLILDIHPPTAQVFADGYYIGIPEDFRFEDGGAVLEPGPHRIDIMERDYEPVSFDVHLTRGQSATFRHVLTPMKPAPRPAPDAAPPAEKQPVTFYVIPGCYMGNVPPKDTNLPATCDTARALSVQY